MSGRYNENILPETRGEIMTFPFPSFCPSSLAIITSYGNLGGVGNRTASISVSLSSGLQNASSSGSPSNLVNGSTVGNNDTASIFFAASGIVDAGTYIRFDFGDGASRVITEVKWYQNSLASHGIWRWQGSHDASAWTDVGSSFLLGSVTTQTQTSMSANTAGYRYYQLVGISGNTSDSPWIHEIEFKIF